MKRGFWVVKRCKGQAAMEYVHTYGWVLAIVLMISGVLVYYDVSSADDIVPKGCSFLSGINCLDVSAEENLFYVVVLNEFGFTAGNISINITGTCNSVANTSDGNIYGNLNVLLPNKQATYVFECQNLSGLNIAETVYFGYRTVETGQEHMKVGTLQFYAEP